MYILKRQVKLGKKRYNELGLLVDVDVTNGISPAYSEGSDGVEGVTRKTEEPSTKAVE